MKKTPATLLVLLILGFAAVTAEAQTNNLAALGTDNFTVDTGSTTATYTQTTTNLSFVSPYALGDTLGGVFFSTYDWSAYSATNYVFGLFLSSIGTSQAVPFHVEFYNGALTEIVNTYSGDSSGLSAASTFVPLTLSLAGTGDLSSIGGMQFTWDGAAVAGTTVVADSIGVTLVPEPSTWALLALGSALFGGLALRRHRFSSVRH